VSGPGIRNLFDIAMASSQEDVFETLLSAFGRVRVERILSRGQSSPPGFWYDQPQTEWILVLQGTPHLRIEGEPESRRLKPGDSLTLQPHIRHRVEWTDPDSVTIWLAVHIEEA